MSTSNYGKTVILTLIKDNKELLFGTLRHPLTNEDRHDAWKEIHEKAKSLGVTRAEKSWEYLRDVTWANWKRRTLVKRDNKRKTGTGGGKEAKYTDMDNLVLDIVGRDSPLLMGLNVPESIPDDNGIEAELLSIHSSPEREPVKASKRAEATCNPTKAATKAKPKVMFRYTGPRDEACPSTSTHVQVEETDDINNVGKKKQLNNHGRKRRSYDNDTDNIAKKQQLQIDLMEIDRRTKAIQLYKLEKKYDLPPSPYTQEFHDAIKDAAEEN